MQVNSKLRGVIRVPANTATAAIEATALASEKVQPFIAGKTIKKIREYVDNANWHQN